MRALPLALCFPPVVTGSSIYRYGMKDNTCGPFCILIVRRELTGRAPLHKGCVLHIYLTSGRWRGYGTELCIWILNTTAAVLTSNSTYGVGLLHILYALRDHTHYLPIMCTSRYSICISCYDTILLVSVCILYLDPQLYLLPAAACCHP